MYDKDDSSLLAHDKSIFSKIRYLEEVIKKKREELVRSGVFKKSNLGSLSSIPDGAAYIDTLYELMKMYVEIRGFKKAINIGEEIMRLDNDYMPHVHAIVVSLDAYFEDEGRIFKICRKCNRPCIIYFVSMMIVYYKKGNFKKAQEYLELVNKVNSCFIPYFKGKKIKGEEADIVRSIIKDFDYLIDSAPHIDEFIIKKGNV